MQKVIVAGVVSSVKELKQVGDRQVFNFSIAVSNGKDKDGNWRDSTFWDCALWDKRAESVSRFLTKGTRITAEGRPAARAYEGKAYLQLTVNDFTLQGGGDGQAQTHSNDAPPKPQQQAEIDDEIPF